MKLQGFFSGIGHIHIGNEVISYELKEESYGQGLSLFVYFKKSLNKSWKIEEIKRTKNLDGPRSQLGRLTKVVGNKRYIVDILDGPQKVKSRGGVIVITTEYINSKGSI